MTRLKTFLWGGGYGLRKVENQDTQKGKYILKESS